MINEQVLLNYIQKPFDLGHKTRNTLHTKFLDVTAFVEHFIEESGSSIGAFQRVGEGVGRFLGKIIGLCFAYVLMPGLAFGVLITMRAFQRGQARWSKIQSWVTDPMVEPVMASSGLFPNPENAETVTNPFAPESLDDTESKAGEMVALPPCDQPVVDESPLRRSVSFVQQTASELPHTLSPKAIKVAYGRAKRKTQHNPILTGLVTAGFTAVSFFAIQLDPTREAAIASNLPQPNAEDVTVLDPSQDDTDWERDPNDMN